MQYSYIFESRLINIYVFFALLKYVTEPSVPMLYSYIFESRLLNIYVLGFPLIKLCFCERLVILLRNILQCTCGLTSPSYYLINLSASSSCFNMLVKLQVL